MQPEAKMFRSRLPWGDDFDPAKAWNTIKNFPETEKNQKTQLTRAQADREELERLRDEGGADGESDNVFPDSQSTDLGLLRLTSGGARQLGVGDT